MRCHLMFFSLVSIFLWDMIYCQTTNVIEGIDTNIGIGCELNEQRDAPFWRINNEVYDLFHVPIYFRVDSYAFLTIPKAHHLFDEYTFQCVLTDHTTDPVSEIAGRITELTVEHSGRGPPLLIPRDTLELHYQELQIDSNNITMGWIHNVSGSQCEVDHFIIEAFNLNDIIANTLRPVASYNSTTSSFSLPFRSAFMENTSDPLYFRITASDREGRNCGSGDGSEQTFYNLHPLLGVQRTVYGPLGGSVCIPIPDTFPEGEVATPSLVWPARPGVPGDCYCPPYENVTLTKFSDCYKTCNTTFTIHSINGSICFSDLNSSMNDTSVHYVTLTDRCDFPDCFIRTLIASYTIIVAGPPDPPNILYFSSNDSICLTASTNPRYCVLFYHVTVSTLSETVVVVLSREQQCFTLSDVLSNDCESFMISATANNSIGTSQVSFLNGVCAGPPDMPNVTVINNSICFNASSERSVDYYEVSITDVTDLDTPLSGIYTTSQCLTITSDLFPRVCAPFQVSIEAVNALGASNVTSIVYNSITRSGLKGPQRICDCFHEKEQIEVSVLTLSQSSVAITLTCGLNETTIEELIIQFQNSDVEFIKITCNENVTIAGLSSGRQYLIVGKYINQNRCILGNFTTTAMNIPLVNDTIIGDPLFSVPISVPINQLQLLNVSKFFLCYEVYGESEQWFNLVTDECVTINAHYTAVNEGINVINEIGVRAVDDKSQCVNIHVYINQTECTADINGNNLRLKQKYSSGGVTVKRYTSRVRVSVPNCADITLVMWILCKQIFVLDDPNMPGSQSREPSMLKFVIMRGLNIGHEIVHGLLGQFWKIPVQIKPYTGLLIDGQQPRNYYIVNITTSNQPRSYVGELHHFTWGLEGGPCLYVGDRQSGPIYEVYEPNDGVIEGDYKDYQVTNAFSEVNYKFSRFNEMQCAIPSASPIRN